MAYIGSIDENFPFVNTLVSLGDETFYEILLTSRKIHWRLIKHHVLVDWVNYFNLAKTSLVEVCLTREMPKNIELLVVWFSL